MPRFLAQSVCNGDLRSAGGKVPLHVDCSVQDNVLKERSISAEEFESWWMMGILP